MEEQQFSCEDCRVYSTRGILNEELEYYDEKIGSLETEISACGLIKTIFWRKAELINQQIQEYKKRQVIAIALQQIEACPGPVAYPLIIRNSVTEVDAIIRCGHNPDEITWYSDPK